MQDMSGSVVCTGYVQQDCCFKSCEIDDLLLLLSVGHGNYFEHDASETTAKLSLSQNKCILNSKCNIFVCHGTKTQLQECKQVIRQ